MKRSKNGNPVCGFSVITIESSHLGGDTGILNKSDRDQRSFRFTVVGIKAAEGFSSARWGSTPALFVPMTMKREITPSWDDLEDRRGQWLNIIGRLQPGESRVQAEAEANPVWYSIRSEEFKKFPNDAQTERSRQGFLGKTHLALLDGAKGFSPLRSDMRTPLLVVMGMVILVLAMACVNTASLLLVRAAARIREFSMRYALGREPRASAASIALGGPPVGPHGGDRRTRLGA